MKLCLNNAAGFVPADTLEQLKSQTEAANQLLENGQGAGNDYIGWVHLPSSITSAFLDEVQSVADDLRKRCEVVIVAGIGGSYLGARAVNEALCSAFDAYTAKGGNVYHSCSDKPASCRIGILCGSLPVLLRVQ